ncbi:WxL domain-containing protein [Enterococcus sp. OL5]|uniref:WxL domain-containing protein n=1 Tax=Enterococcus sp. OL5 TaxID=2590214 RepID=UPI00112AED39|nr:WxL domain-containing protein [Enterococcus sp. OL5]TPR55090.1 hypothetical protein FJU10_18725 [Enterococcus sp. OL5]
MTTRFNRLMLVLGTTLLIIQAVFMPVGMVYAETTMDTEEQELVELPPMKNYLEEEQISDPRFFFTRPRMQGTAEEPLQVTFFSDQEVSEARVFLPKEATLLKDQLPTGISVEEGAQPNEWIVQSKRAQNSFLLPLVVEQVGNYELSVEETTAHLEISEKEETSEEVPVEEIESSENDLAGQEELKEEIREYTKKASRLSYFTEFHNPLFNYSHDDQLIEGWSLFIGPGVLGRIRELGISNVLDDSNEFRYALDESEVTDKILFRKQSENQGLNVQLEENTTLIAGQHFQTVPGKEYLVRGDFTGNSRRGLIVYEGETFAGSGGLNSSTGISGLPEVSFIAQSSTYTITARLFALSEEVVGESSINSVYAGEKINLEIEYVDENGKSIHENNQFYGIKGEKYTIEAIEIPGYILNSDSNSQKGVLSDNKTIKFEYTTEAKNPVDPLEPETEVFPENKPELPEGQGQLSIDFVSSFNFGTQAISAHDQTYYAQPQRLLNEDGTINESEERPNYVQISDRRPDTDRHGWQLAVTQRGEFEGANGQGLAGARLRLMNQQVASAQGGDEPHLQQTNPLTLVPNVRRVLLYAQGDEGTGTWVYRFGNSETAGESVALDVPKGANPEATHYKATLVWELSAVPEN